MFGSHRILIGDVLAGLATLPDASVHCCVTSPPYWGLRDYGCEGQIGLEPTPAAYLERMVAVFREVRRVLRDDGTCWVNMGDGYASTPPGCGADGVSRSSTLHGHVSEVYRETLRKSVGQKRNTIVGGLKPKDLIGMPWRLAFALQADGWYLRSEIIWAKPNPMPESVTDRPTKAHEQIFLLTKAARYWYDAEAIKEPSEEPERAGKLETSFSVSDPGVTMRADVGRAVMRTATRNARSVWPIATQPYPEAHFATFPEAIPERCISAGCPPLVCSKCYNPAYETRPVGPRTVRPPMQSVQGAVLREGAEVLQPPVCEPVVSREESETSKAVRAVSGADPKSPDAVLLSGVLGEGENGDGYTAAAAIDGHQQLELARRQGSQSRVRSGAYAGTPERAQERVHTGTPASHVAGAGATTSENGVCPPPERQQGGQPAREPGTDGDESAQGRRRLSPLRQALHNQVSECCGAPLTRGTVLDPFSGSGTTGAVAVRLGRDYIGCELNRDYAAMSERRIGLAKAPGTFRVDKGESPLFNGSAA